MGTLMEESVASKDDGTPRTGLIVMLRLEINRGDLEVLIRLGSLHIASLDIP